MNGVGARFRAMFVFLILVFGLVEALGQIGPAAAEGLEPLQIVTASGTHDFKVEVAADDASQERGLMFRRFMPADHGMLFEFKQNASVAFWMKNTYIPLDMIFIARNGSVTHIAADAEPLSEALIPSGGPCAAVLELNGGTAARIGAKVGDKVRHRFFPP